jgi:hypothetical protein
VAKDDQEEAYERLLSGALARTIDLLKYAETKNAALLTFSSASTVGSINFLTTKSSLPWGYDLAFKVALPLFSVSALVSLCSFVPRLDPRDFFRRQVPNPAPNLLFFGDAAKIGADRADETFRKAYQPAPNRSATDRYLNDLAVQIAVNGEIARRKFGFFNFAALTDAAAVACLGLALLANLIAGVLGLHA